MRKFVNGIILNLFYQIVCISATKKNRDRHFLIKIRKFYFSQYSYLVSYLQFNYFTVSSRYIFQEDKTKRLRQLSSLKWRLGKLLDKLGHVLLESDYISTFNE